MRNDIWTFTTSVMVTIVILLFIVAVLMLTIPSSNCFRVRTNMMMPPDGTVIALAYDSYMALIISTFTRSNWNHVAVFAGGYVYETASHPEIGMRGVIKVPWDKWLKVCDGIQMQLISPIDPVDPRDVEAAYRLHTDEKIRLSISRWTALLVKMDLTKEDETYCAKFVRSILAECGLVTDDDIDLLLPGTYPSLGTRQLKSTYMRAIPVYNDEGELDQGEAA